MCIHSMVSDDAIQTEQTGVGWRLPADLCLSAGIQKARAWDRLGPDSVMRTGQRTVEGAESL